MAQLLASQTPCTPLPSAIVRGSLAHGLLVCLGRLDRDPDCFGSAAVAWHARWCEEVAGADIAESLAVLSALEGLGGADPSASARALRDLCERHQLHDVAAVLERWRCMRIRIGGRSAPPLSRNSQALS